MNVFFTAAIILLAATVPVSAQQIQDRFHIISVQPCFETFEMVDEYIKYNTKQTRLFGAVGDFNAVTPNNQEVFLPGIVTVYADQDTGEFTMTKTFDDGVTCLITEGRFFQPYVK